MDDGASNTPEVAHEGESTSAQVQPSRTRKRESKKMFEMQKKCAKPQQTPERRPWHEETKTQTR